MERCRWQGVRQDCSDQQDEAARHVARVVLGVEYSGDA